MLPVDLIGDRAPITIGTRPVDEALLDEATSELVEPRNAAGASDGAAPDAAVGLDREGELHASADARFS